MAKLFQFISYKHYLSKHRLCTSFGNQNEYFIPANCLESDYLRACTKFLPPLYAVSYTHLDVYKRQVIHLSHRFSNFRMPLAYNSVGC